MFSLVSGGLWSIALVLDLFVVSRTSPRVFQIELFGVLVAVVIALFSRFAPLSAHVKADAGLWLMVLNSAAIAALERAMDDAAGTPRNLSVDPPLSLSWIAIAILLTAAILPNTPRKTLVAAMVSASMGPLGVWLAYLRGAATPSVVNTFVMYLPNYTCAAAAILPSLIFQRLGRKLREARAVGNYQLITRLGRGGMGEVGWLVTGCWPGLPPSS